MADITQILQDIAVGTITPQEAEKKIADLKDRGKKISIKVGQKGGICIYGLRKMPITLYESELISILNYFLSEWRFKPDIDTWFSDNRGSLSSKQ